MTGLDLLWTWVAGFLTLCIFSFLYKDNPFYKFAEHVYVGVSAGYWISQNYNDVLKTILFPNLWLAWHGVTTDHVWLWDKWLYVVPMLMGIMLLMRLVPSVSWVSRWPLAFIVGMGAGYAIVFSMDAAILEQIRATVVKLWGIPDYVALLRNWLILIGVVCGLLYFYFSVEHRGPVMGTASRIGIWFLMITFGSAFGYTVMARVSLLIGRMSFLIQDLPTATWQYFHR